MGKKGKRKAEEVEVEEVVEVEEEEEKGPAEDEFVPPGLDADPIAFLVAPKASGPNWPLAATPVRCCTVGDSGGCRRRRRQSSQEQGRQGGCLFSRLFGSAAALAKDDINHRDAARSWLAGGAVTPACVYCDSSKGPELRSKELMS